MDNKGKVRPVIIPRKLCKLLIDCYILGKFLLEKNSWFVIRFIYEEKAFEKKHKGLKIRNRIIFLLEAQSAWSINILIRDLMYLTDTYSRYFVENKINIHLQ